MVFLFILQCLPFSTFVVLKRRNSQEQVLMNLHLRHTKTAACTQDIISNAPTINTINMCSFLHVLHYIVDFIICADIYNLDKETLLFFVEHNYVGAWKARTD